MATDAIREECIDCNLPCDPACPVAKQQRADLAWAMCIVHLADSCGVLEINDRQQQRHDAICARLGVNPFAEADWIRLSAEAKAMEDDDG